MAKNKLAYQLLTSHGANPEAKDVGGFSAASMMQNGTFYKYIGTSLRQGQRLGDVVCRGAEQSRDHAQEAGRNAVNLTKRLSF